MTDLVSAVLGRISQLEAGAREAAKYSARSWDSATSAVVDLGGGDLDALIPVPASPIARHIVGHDPQAVLRLCQAHRDIVALHPPGEGADAYLCAVCHLDGQNEDCTYPCDTLRVLARGYGVEDGEDR